MNVRYVTLEEALTILHQTGWGPLRDAGLLDSALNRPRASAFGVDAYETFPLKAAALMHSLAGNHPLVDGNKRAAWHLTYVFCRINQVDLTLDEDDAFDLVMDVAAGLDDLGVIAKRLFPGP